MRPQLPTISIIVPNLNNGGFLNECLQSLVEQRYPCLEIIVIDGGSQDNSLEVIRKFEHAISYWCSETDQGQAHAINKGLEKVNGELFNWLNSDDILLPHALHRVAEIYLSFQPEVIAGRCVHFLEFQNTEPLKVSGVKHMSNLEKALVYHDLGQPAHFYKTNSVRELGGIDDRFNFSFDFDLWMKYLLRYGQENLYVEEKSLAGFRIHPNSKTSTSEQQFLREDLNIWLELFQRLGYEYFIRDVFSLDELGPPNRLPDVSKIDSQRLCRHFCYRWFKVYLKRGDLETSRRILQWHIQHFFAIRSRIKLGMLSILLLVVSADAANEWLRKYFVK